MVINCQNLYYNPCATIVIISLKYLPILNENYIYGWKSRHMNECAYLAHVCLVGDLAHVGSKTWRSTSGKSSTRRETACIPTTCLRGCILGFPPSHVPSDGESLQVQKNDTSEMPCKNATQVTTRLHQEIEPTPDQPRPQRNRNSPSQSNCHATIAPRGSSTYVATSTPSYTSQVAPKAKASGSEDSDG